VQETGLFGDINWCRIRCKNSDFIPGGSYNEEANLHGLLPADNIFKPLPYPVSLLYLYHTCYKSLSVM